jgi:hypothetical protein
MIGSTDSEFREFPGIILVFLLVDWPIFMRRKAVYALAGEAEKYGSTVVAINRPLCPLSTIVKKPDRARELIGRPRLQKLDGNLYLYSPRYFIHDSIAAKSGLLERLNLAALIKSYRHLCKRIGIDEPRPVVWFYHPQQSYVIDMMPGSFNVLQIKDFLGDHMGNESPGLDDQLRTIHDSVNLLVCASRKLFERYSSGFKHAALSGNGLDRETFTKLVKRDVPPIPEIERIPSPRIGYTGLISQRLDWDLVCRIAERKPDWNLVFVGKVFDSTLRDRTRQYSNIHYPGWYDHDKMPSVLRSFDIGFMPYLDNEFFRHSNPLKFYEYAAAGLRTISSNMEELIQFPDDLVKVVPNRADDWIEAIQGYLDADPGTAKKLGTDVAGRFIWEDTAKDLLAEISDLL